MRYTIDTETRRLTIETDAGRESHDLFSPAALAVLSRLWLRVGWSLKYSYQFTWLGRPIIQMPEDMVRIQELIYQVRPDVILETGVAHGGGQVFFASLCKLLGKGRVIGVDVEIRPHNRTALEGHELWPLITLIEGSSTDPAVVDRVRREIRPGEKVLVFLDASHTKDHVLAELEAYGPLVSADSYIIVADGIMEDLVGAPGAGADWAWDNPRRAAAEFLARHPDFHLVLPPPLFNEGMAGCTASYWPDGYLKRVG